MLKVEKNGSVFIFKHNSLLMPTMARDCSFVGIFEAMEFTVSECDRTSETHFVDSYGNGGRWLHCL